MVPLNEATAAVRQIGAEWGDLQIGSLRFLHQDTARLMLLALGIACLLALVLRVVMARKHQRDRVAIPAVLGGMPGPRLATVRHLPVGLFACGLVSLGVGLADPYTAIARRQVTYPGRRIALMIDASTSMVTPFKATGLNAKAPDNAVFYTSVAAAERFVQMRRRGRYHDLFSLIEFGNEAYVITPFTNDYENILLSISLISEETEWAKFPDQGTTIAQAIEQGVELFRTFDFLDASGNLLVMFSDGEDTQMIVHGRTVTEILADAVKSKIPVYFIRTSYNKTAGAIVPDALWRPAIEKTGGKFYAAANETAILSAIQDIDRLSAGRIAVTQYSTEEVRFQPFALAAAACFALALALKLTLPVFSRFP